mmetsp:Transcript_147823/g.474518  ORF Transcript_147823/g.474518 Transcript_147823/m.474518 type:complete len:106 (-) Transcript_147823:32-349(-)
MASRTVNFERSTFPVVSQIGVDEDFELAVAFGHECLLFNLQSFKDERSLSCASACQLTPLKGQTHNAARHVYSFPRRDLHGCRRNRAQVVGFRATLFWSSLSWSS